jgi:hypothetical protein
MAKSSLSQFELAVAGISLVLAAGFGFAHRKQPHSMPEDSVARLFTALASKNLDSVKAELGEAAYNDFLRTFGVAKHQRIQRAYDRAFRLGAPRWNELRERGRELAGQEYERLRQRVSALGKQAFADLAVSERMRLMDDPAAYDEFVFAQGVSALSGTERPRIGTAAEFRARLDRDRFVEREAFAALSAEDQALAGSAEALSDGQNAAKLSLHDKFGIPQLPTEQQNDIGSVTRAELQDEAVFTLKHGAPLAKEFLEQRSIPADAGLRNCTYPWADDRGSLINGDEAVCSLAIPVSRGQQEAVVGLRKDGFAWRVTEIRPTLTNIRW